MIKNLLVIRKTWVQSLGWEDPLKKGIPTPVFLPGESKGQRSLAGYGPWGNKELHMTVTKHSTVLHCICISLVLFSRSVVSDSWRSHGLQHTRLPCPSPSPGVYPNSCPLSRCCHPTTSSSVFPFSSCSQSFPASGSFPTSQLFVSGGQSIGVSASVSVLPMNTQN